MVDLAQRPQFGSRFLADKSEVFKYNAWDNVQWDEEQEASAQKKVSENSIITFSSAEIKDLENLASTKWDGFYSIHQNRFFKDRQWLFTEFSELQPSEDPGNISEFKEPSEEAEGRCQLKDSCVGLDLTFIKELRKDEGYPGENSSFKIWEVGCGVGNTIFPILEKNVDSNLFVYGSDFSETALSIVTESESYNPDRCHAFVCDLTSETWVTPFLQGTIDVIVCIFVLSALYPVRAKLAVHNLAKYLKPGGVLLFRDYGRYDMTQLRFKKGRCLGENFYARGDGTLCYFFTQEDVEEMMTEAGLEEFQNLVDRRLQVNRGKQLKMYRVWVQAKYRKPLKTPI